MWQLDQLSDKSIDNLLYAYKYLADDDFKCYNYHHNDIKCINEYSH